MSDYVQQETFSSDEYFDESALLETFIEIKLKNLDDFRSIRETLTRIGIASFNRDEKSKPSLYQSAHILHKKGKYYIVHFKEMLQLDGYDTDFSESDKQRRNTIARLLSDWGLLEIVNPAMLEGNLAPVGQIKIVRFSEKDSWNLVPKYHMGKKF